MLRIKKRDGGIEDFDITKIENAIEKAFMAEHKFYNHDIIEMLALRVTAEFNKKIVSQLKYFLEPLRHQPKQNIH